VEQDFGRGGILGLQQHLQGAFTRRRACGCEGELIAEVLQSCLDAHVRFEFEQQSGCGFSRIPGFG
jgi:hypothetical protein